MPSQPVFGTLFVEIAEGLEDVEDPIPVGIATEHVVRFSPSQILEEPIVCAEKISYMVDGQTNQILSQYLKSGRLEELIFGPRSDESAR